MDIKRRFFDHTLRRFRQAWRDVVPGGDHPPAGPEFDDKALDSLRRHMAECLAAPGGEVAARRQAADLGRAYLTLNRTGKRQFLTLLAEDFGVAAEDLDRAVRALDQAATLDDKLAAQRALKTVLTPPRSRLLTRFNALPEGVKFLVDLRADLLAMGSNNPHLSAMGSELKELLASWFDLGFLDLKPITWNSPAALLEKLIAYEAVHEIRSWSDLRNRLESDRRCYALFHPRLPDEPLAFVEVALTRGLADSIQALLDESAPLVAEGDADTAIFYSISNTQKGLRGISFGDYLIKRVVARLGADMPQIKTFATLSPIPGFRLWLDHALADGAVVLTEDEKAALAALGEGGEEAFARAEGLRERLVGLCGRYFAARRGDGRPVDPVARFHLANGARLERINWLADRSKKGLRQSYGLMVNYRYRQRDLEANAENYARTGAIAAARPLREIIKK